MAGTRAVIVPFAELLAELLPDNEIRLRRDFPQLLGVIGAHALLHQLHRECDSEGRVLAELADYHAVYALVGDVFRSAVGIPSAMRETVAAVA